MLAITQVDVCPIHLAVDQRGPRGNHAAAIKGASRGRPYPSSAIHAMINPERLGCERCNSVSDGFGLIGGIFTQNSGSQAFLLYIYGVFYPARCRCPELSAAG